MCSSNIKRVLKLAAFDFDHTIIVHNSDTYIDKILFEKTTNNLNNKYPEEIEKKTELHGWTTRMNSVFEYMFSKFNIKGKDILECLKEIKIDDSMVSLIKSLKENDYKLIILSDANSLFIETILKENRLSDFFDTIYTNEAQIDSNERLVVKPLNETYNENGEPFKCLTGLCTENICKGKILNDYLGKHLGVNDVMELKHLIFIGDGRNDYCGGLCLNEKHHFCVRKNFNLAKLLAKKEHLVKNIKAEILYWDSAQDIIDNLTLIGSNQ